MTYTNPCGCLLTKEQMIMLCPVDATDDSVVICKVGTNYVAGSNRSAMTWPEYISSEYFGGEGKLVSCKTGKELFPGKHSLVLSYKNKKLTADERFQFVVFESKKDTWIEIELPVWRKTVYALNNEIRIAPDSFIFKPVYQDKKVFAKVSKEYEEEQKKTDHYFITNTVNHLLACSLSGDTVSEKRLLNIRNDFSAYYDAHEDSEKLLEEKLLIYKTYKSYIEKGGKRSYYDLSKFVYFKNLPDMQK